MKYVELGNTGLKASRFGLGCLRFIEDEKSAIDIIRYALDNGVNYLDTAYYYNNSEEIVGKALTKGYRDKAILVTKSPISACETKEDLEKYLDIELKRLQTDCIDIYLLHNLDILSYEKVEKLDVFDFFEAMKKKGKIKHHGCSLHGSYDHFKKTVDNYNWELMTLQVGLLDTDSQAGVRGLKYANKKNLPVAIMSPLRGGNLVKFAPQKVHDLINDFPVKRSLAEWGFRYLYNMPEVSVVLSGVSNLEQLKENIRIFSESSYNVINNDEIKLLNEIKDAFMECYKVPCTNCAYCMPCVKGVNIPEVFNLYNKQAISKHWTDKYFYKNELIRTETDASQCVKCGVCLTKCPQEIDIIKMLTEAHNALTAENK